MQLHESIKKRLLFNRHLYRIRKDKEMMGFIQKLSIMTSSETLDYIIKNKCNVSRYGDGEFAVMTGGSNGFQKKDNQLAQRLKDVIFTRNPKLFLCVPHTYKSFKGLTLDSKSFAAGFIITFFKDSVMPYISDDQTYGDSLFTRFYMSRSDKRSKEISEYVNRLRSIWAGQDVLIVEGEFSRNGVGNDLFENVQSLQRIICPARDAFNRYDEILQSIRRHGKGKLVLMALGMTATVLACDLLNDGIWAIDLGHIDTEYEWFKMKAKKKVAIPGKYVNEVAEKGEYRNVLNDKDDINYQAQIVDIIK